MNFTGLHCPYTALYKMFWRALWRPLYLLTNTYRPASGQAYMTRKLDTKLLLVNGHFMALCSLTILVVLYRVMKQTAQMETILASFMWTRAHRISSSACLCNATALRFSPFIRPNANKAIGSYLMVSLTFAFFTLHTAQRQ